MARSPVTRGFEEIMRNKPSRRPSVRVLHLAIVASLLALMTPVVGRSHVATAATPTPWEASGPGSFTLDSDGSVTPPQITYDLGEDPADARFADQTWTLSTVAEGDTPQTVPYRYIGYHAFFQVIVHLDAFIIRDGVPLSTTSLVADGPVDCCTPPSGGFSYGGSHTFNVVDGDTYGFTVGGRNFDSDPHFFGTLTLSDAPYDDPLTVASNTSWTTALPLTFAGLAGSLTQPGEVRWYKFPVSPDSQVQVDLTNLNENFDLTMFRDIDQVFNTLTSTQDLTKLSAQFAGDVFSPSVYSPSVYSPSVYSPSVYSPSVYSPSVYSPSVYSPSVYSQSDAFVQAFSSAQTRSLIGVSARENAESESIRSATWNNTGDFYVRVQGRNGTFSATPFRLDLTTTGGPCSAIQLESYSSLPNLAGTPGAAEAVILTDGARLEQLTGLGASLDQLGVRTAGDVVDVSLSPRINALNLQADTYNACPYAKNLVAEAIREVVNSYRDDIGTLKYVVIAGGDSVIPFFRYADSAGIGPESDFVPPALDTSASQASLRRNYVLGQDAYGAISDLTLKGAVLPVPDLAVGRLVESPIDIIGMIDSFLGLTNGVLPTPTSSLVTGYDFLTSAADSVQTDFAAGLGPNGRADTLITDQGVPTTTTTVGAPTRDRSWTASDLSTAFLGSRHDLVFLAGHFSANDALAADYQTSLSTTDLAARPNLLANALVISAGCHAGYNLLDADGVPGLTHVLDWPEAMAKQRATFISGTGYQYADTDFLAYSAKLYALLATQLRNGSGAVPLGEALVNAKQDYLAGVSNLTGIDQKALIESTLYGLPMTGVNLPSGRIPNPGSVAGVTPALVPTGPGQQLGLKSAPLVLNPTLTQPPPKPVLNADGSSPVPATFFRWLTGPDGVQSEAALPALPKQIDDVTSSTGEVLRGVGFVGGTYSDTAGVIPLTGAPATEQNGVHTNFVSPVFFPQRLATVNYFGALDGNGTDGRTRLITTPAQYRSDVASTDTNTEREFSQLGLQLYYSSNTTTYGNNTPGLSAPPSISGVADTVVAGEVQISAHITGDPSAGIQKTWVTYTGEDGPFHGSWQSVDLVQNPLDSTLWAGTLTLPSGQTAANVRYIVQAVNGVGLVGLDNNLGGGYTPGVRAGVTPPQTGLTTTLTLETGAEAGISGTSVEVGATLDAPAGSLVTFSLGSVSATATLDEFGRANATLPLQDAVGHYTLSAVFAGDGAFRSSSKSRDFEITMVPTTLIVDAGTSETISATLTRTVSNTPVPQQTVLFEVTGPVTKKFTATTDPQGRAKVAIGALANGTYTVVAKYAGTPSTFLASEPSTAFVTLQAVGPTLTNVNLTPATFVVGGTTNLTASVADASGVSRVEYFVGTDPGVSFATPATFAAGSVSVVFGANLTAGTYTVGVRALDASGNWSATSTTTLTVTQIRLSFSTNANRTGAVDLAGSAVSGNVAIFATPAASTSRVVLVGFYLDDPNRTRLPYWVQLASPYDLNGTSTNGSANLFDTRQLLNGTHTLTVELVRLNGTVERRTATFTVNNPAPAVTQRIKVSTTVNRSNPQDLQGRALTGPVAIFVAPTTSVKSVAYWLDRTNLTVAPRSVDNAAQFDFNGTAKNGQAILFNVGTLTPGSHRIAARITYTNGTTAFISSTFTR